MTVETLYCAICGERTAPDSDHVELDVETVLMKDRNRLDDWVLHIECYRDLTDEWNDPV